MPARRTTRVKAAREHKAPESQHVGVPTSTIQTQVLQSSLKAVGLLTLAAVFSTISQISLSPVYGSIPPSAYHSHVTAAAIVMPWVAIRRLPRHLSKKALGFLPILAFLVPTIQSVLSKYSGQLGPVYGPVITELLTYFLLVFISVLGVAVFLENIDWRRKAGDTLPAVAFYGFFTVIQKASKHFIIRKMGSSMIFTRSGLQFMTAVCYALLLPSRVIVFAVLPMFHSAVYNPHLPLSQNLNALNTTLQAHGYSIVARQESVTGYISVLDNVKDGFRVLRCDHSLLGGEWLHQQENPSSKVREPIYAIFVMLEAVRLIESPTMTSQTVALDSEKRALVMSGSLVFHKFGLLLTI